MAIQHPDPAATPPPTAGEIFLLFCRVGLTSFGGGTSAWLYREMVHAKGWISEEEFLDALALCQALPGINITNMAVWMGRRFLGVRGALSALAGIVLLPSIVIVLIAMLFSAIAHYSLTQIALTGAVAAAVGLPFSMGLKLASKVRRTLIPLGVMTITFVAVGLFKLPLFWVVLLCGGGGIAAEYFRPGPA